MDLSIKQLVKIYEVIGPSSTVKVPVLASLSGIFSDERISVIKGPSGSGKTTLMNILLGLEPYQAGQIFFNNKLTQNISNICKTQSGFHIGFIPQFPEDILSFSMNVLENIFFSISMRNMKINKNIKDSVNDLLNYYQLDHLKNSPLNILSGGELQRVSQIVALIAKPKFLLLDEPTASVDLKNKNLFYNHLFDFISSNKAVAILVTHDDYIRRFKDISIHYLKNGVFYDNNN